MLRQKEFTRKNKGHPAPQNALRRNMSAAGIPMDEVVAGHRIIGKLIEKEVFMKHAELIMLSAPGNDERGREKG